MIDEPDIDKCPRCNGPADNGFDRCVPPSPYLCTKCENVPWEDFYVRGFTCGAFDLCHAGHILMFKECRQHCNWLIVGLQKDPSVDRPEKNKPIQSFEERKIQLAAVRYIDQIVFYETEDDLYNLLLELKPDVRILGVDWKGKKFTGHDIPGIKNVFNSRDHSYSSSELRERIYNEVHSSKK